MATQRLFALIVVTLVVVVIRLDRSAALLTSLLSSMSSPLRTCATPSSRMCGQSGRIAGTFRAHPCVRAISHSRRPALKEAGLVGSRSAFVFLLAEYAVFDAGIDFSSARTE